MKRDESIEESFHRVTKWKKIGRWKEGRGEVRLVNEEVGGEGRGGSE